MLLARLRTSVALGSVLVASATCDGKIVPDDASLDAAPFDANADTVVVVDSSLSDAVGPFDAAPVDVANIDASIPDDSSDGAIVDATFVDVATDAIGDGSVDTGNSILSPCLGGPPYSIDRTGVVVASSRWYAAGFTSFYNYVCDDGRYIKGCAGGSLCNNVSQWLSSTTLSPGDLAALKIAVAQAITTDAGTVHKIDPASWGLQNRAAETWIYSGQNSVRLDHYYIVWNSNLTDGHETWDWANDPAAATIRNYGLVPPPPP